jgi:hypothetical protein
MNNINLSAFLDELEKIALPTGGFALAGRRAIVSEGAQGAGNLAKVLHQGQQFSQAARATETARHAHLEKLLQSGAFNPASHDAAEFMRSGNIIPKKAPAAIPSSAATQVKPRPSQEATRSLTRPEGTAVVSPQERAATPMPAAAKPAAQVAPQPVAKAAPARPVTRGPPPAVVKPGMFPQQKPAAPAQGWKKWAPHVGIGVGAAGLGYGAAS